MKLSEVLVPSAIRLRLQAGSRADVLVELVELLEASHGIRSQGEILARVMNREDHSSTGIFPGTAIPHGKARSVDRIVGACGIAPEGIDFKSMDGGPTHLFILLVSPESLTKPYLQLLANVAQLLKQDGVRAGLLAARSPEEFLAVVERGEAAFTPQS